MTARSFRELWLVRRTVIFPRIEKREHPARHKQTTAQIVLPLGARPVWLQDSTKQAGLSGWQHKMGVPEKNYIVETNGSGVCLLDYDSDGWLDIYLVNGSTFNALDGSAARLW